MLRSLRHDLRLLKGDPMLILSMCVPLIVWGLMHFIFPLVRDLALDRWSYDIVPWHRQAGYFFMILIPMMGGMVYGFILLDERDEGILMAIAVTPLGKQGYLRLRLGAPLILSFLALLAYVQLLDLRADLGVLQWLLLAALVASQCLLMLLLLGAFAQNKIMGLALSKGFGILLIGPLLDFALPGALKWVGAYSPMFWTGRAFLAEGLSAFWLYFLAALFYHMVLMLILYRRFVRRHN